MLVTGVVGIVVAHGCLKAEASDEEGRHLGTGDGSLGTEACGTAADRDAGLRECIDARLVLVAGVIREVVASCRR